MTARTRPAHVAAALADERGGALVAGLLRDAAFQWTTEAELQAALAAALDDFAVYPEREVSLSDGRSRVDLMAGGVAIEVKTAGGWADVLRQLTRYAKCPEVRSLVLVTTKAQHTELIPERLHDVPV